MAFDETGPGRHDRAQGRDLPARLPAVDRARRVRSDGHHLRPEHPRDRHRPRGAQRLRDQLHRGDAHHQGDLPRREDQRRRQQPVVLVPRQRRRPRGDALGVPLPRDQGRHGHGHRQRRPAGRSTRTSQGSARARRGHHLQPPSRRDRAAGRVRRDGEGRRQEAEHDLAWREATVEERLSTRWCTASSTSSRRTSRRRGRSTRGRSRSSKGR